jgi:hypothetical protein
MNMDEMMPAQYPYVIDNINFGDRFITINYTDPAANSNDIAHFDQLVFPASLVDEDLGELTDSICEIIEKIQVMRRGPATRLVPKVAAPRAESG